ncbi:glycosyltransferase [candidate division KSB1 bacterium]|nr:glycosyltransferase [candidate division KSB1 bacterium]
MKKKVLLLGKIPPPDFGPAIATKILLASDLNDHYELIHLDTRINHSLSSMYHFKAVKIFKMMRIYLKMIKLLCTRRPEVMIHPISQSTLGFCKDLFLLYAGLLSGTKVLLHLRGSQLKLWLDSCPPLMRKIAIISMKQCYGGIVLGKNLVYLFENILPRNRIFVVPNGGTYPFPEKTPARPYLRILCLSNMKPSKGIEDVLQAAALLKNKFKIPFSLDIVGDWPDHHFQDQMQALSSAQSLPVTFHEGVNGSRKLEFFANCDVFVFTPRAPEGHPWVVVEAMAAGLPIISTDRGAIRESVLHGYNGYLVEHYTQTAQYLVRLYHNPEQRKILGKQSIKHYEQHFTEAKMINRFRFLLEQIIGEKSPTLQTGYKECVQPSLVEQKPPKAGVNIETESFISS